MDTHDSSSPSTNVRASDDSPDPAPPPGTLPRAVRLRARHDGWTIARQVNFLDTLARTHSVTRAARAVRMSRESAHRLRKRDPRGLFAAMWAHCFAPPLTPRAQAEIDQRHGRAMALGCFPLALHRPPTRATTSTS